MAVQVEQTQRQASRPAEAVVPRPFRGEGNVRVAVIGCGAATRQLHLPVLAGHEGVEVVALVDRDLRRANELAAAYRVPLVLDEAARLGRDLAHAALVCTPPFHHAPGAVQMARKGLHVLVEWPMATRYADAEGMVAVAREAEVVLSIGVFRRLLPATRMLRGLIDAGILGRPLSFDVEEGEVYAWPTATLGNHRRDLAGGGVLIDFGSHTLDRLTFFFPGAAEVPAYHGNSRGGIESDCVVRLRMTTAVGEPVEGRVELSRTRNLRNTFRVKCDRGVLELPAGERYRVSVQPRDTEVIDPQVGVPRDHRIEAGWKGQEEAPWFEAFRAQIDDWLGAIRAAEQPALSGASVLPSLALIRDCYDRRPVPMDEPWVVAGADAPAPDPSPADGVHVGGGPRKRVLVTGATGFIGGRLAEVLHLREGWDVRAPAPGPQRPSACRVRPPVAGAA
jgi:predicted dehydrogenase